MADLRVDLGALARSLEADWEEALAALQILLAGVDARVAETTASLALPCHRGCDACCHESVFVTPLEFMAAWDYAQRNLDDATLQRVIQGGLALYGEHRAAIEALLQPPPDGAADHFAIARELRFTCPLLDGQGGCLVYPARELYARLFGCSFNDAGGIYGCELVGAHLAEREVTLLSARGSARRLQDLPLTFMRQVYPYYIHLLYG